MHARRLQIFLSIIISFALCGPVRAVVIDNLYTVVIQVTDNSLATRNQHLPGAFDQVIKKVASSHDILQHPEYLNARDHLDRFVSQYSFTDNKGSYNLTLNFNAQMIQHLLQKIGRGTLGNDRPQVLLWMVVEQNAQANFVTHGPRGEIAAQIDILAKDYGVPIILPLVDLTERLFISESDVLNFNVPALQQAAERYSTSTLLLGKAKQVEDAWQCEWRLVDKDYTASWSATSPTLDGQLVGMVNSLADQLVLQQKSNQQSLAQFAKNGVLLKIKGINSVADYNKVLDNLKQLSIIKKIDVGSVESHQATFIVNADGGMAAITKALQFNALLVADTDQVNSLDLTYKVIS